MATSPLDPPQQVESPVKPATPPVDETPKAPDHELLQPRYQARIWHFESDDRVAEYVQRPLSFMGKMEFFALIGETVDSVMHGDDGLTLDGVLGAAVTARSMFANQTAPYGTQQQGVDAFFQSAAKLLRFAPEFLLDCYVIWLAVPQDERPWVKWAMARSAQDDGLTDDEAIELVEVFIDQNAEAMRDFASKRLPNLRQRLMERTNLSEDPSPSSKRSRPTQRPTRRR